MPTLLLLAHLALAADPTADAHLARAAASTRAERAAMPFVHPGRVDVIGAGALVWRVVLDRVEERAGITEVVSSEHDVLDGTAFSVAAR